MENPQPYVQYKVSVLRLDPVGTEIGEQIRCGTAVY